MPAEVTVAVDAEVVDAPGTEPEEVVVVVTVPDPEGVAMEGGG